ncbi:hypothetical protein H0H81_011416 [Sphagnurus paluster]|uniref:Uncharacterized protein n=1 Tax=Sphagnurus paluster TaxID=117069 RepID=A0A9P7FNP7_9AGAR|nr:hypothetical protein H0H81_011416 [Sphagnurus paluster]
MSTSSTPESTEIFADFEQITPISTGGEKDFCSSPILANIAATFNLDIKTFYEEIEYVLQARRRFLKQLLTIFLCSNNLSYIMQEPTSDIVDFFANIDLTEEQISDILTPPVTPMDYISFCGYDPSDFEFQHLDTTRLEPPKDEAELWDRVTFEVTARQVYESVERGHAEFMHQLENILAPEGSP